MTRLSHSDPKVAYSERARQAQLAASSDLTFAVQEEHKPRYTTSAMWTVTPLSSGGSMQGACRASVGRVQVKGSGEETDIVLFRIARKTREIKEREEK